ncbi:MAG: MoxR family ATPase [Burkholderiaceae bacterium]|nr:MoxR family ATPase [Burkholderiaceae bacterium]
MHDTRDAAPQSVDETVAWLEARDYICDRRLATSIFLSMRLRRPLFLEGEAGVGKTEIAKVLAKGLGVPLVRLQCYEGIDINQAAYEWNVARQMLEIRLAEAGRAGGANPNLYRRDLLIERPLLSALSSRPAPVLLIDELDRADEPFEAFLLEVLSDFQMTIPEFGVVRAEEPPVVVLTSNRTREIHDALKRRCLYAWVDYPNAEQELEIVRRKAPGAAQRLSRDVVDFVQRARRLDLFKSPGVAETIDWTNALTALDAMSLDPESVSDTLGVLLKYQEDLGRLQGAEVGRILDEMRALTGQG